MGIRQAIRDITRFSSESVIHDPFDRAEIVKENIPRGLLVWFVICLQALMYISVVLAPITYAIILIIREFTR